VAGQTQRLGALLLRRPQGLSWPRESPGPPERGLSQDPSLCSLAFSRCSYLGENNRGRLCFQQMRVRKRLCDSSADKQQPGRGAGGGDGAPHQPPSPSRSVWGTAPWPCPAYTWFSFCLLVDFVRFKPEVGFTSSPATVSALGGTLWGWAGKWWVA